MASTDPETELGPFQAGVLVLSIVLLAGLALELLVPVPAEVNRLISLLDTGVCVLLLADFAYRFKTAPNKLRFLKWGWVDLIASIPSIEALRWGRVFRILRVLRLMVALRSLRRLFATLFGSRRQTGLASLLVFTFLVVSFASIGVLLVETTPASNIRTADDALWWAMTTITTVGYGDHYPVTGAGRLIASLLMLCGIGLFGALSGMGASYFLGTGPKQPAEEEKAGE